MDMDHALRLLRLHGFALTYYGGDALRAGAGAPTENQTWRTALNGLAASLAGDASVSAQEAHKMIAGIEANLFDLNAVDPASAGAAVAAAISNSTAKV